MARKKRSSPSPISIGNCKVEIDGNDYACEPITEGFLISVLNGANIKISMDDSSKSSKTSLQDGEKRFPLEDYSFMLVNPKDGDSYTKSLLQEVLKIYMEQLPAMNYAANTGKESYFLEKCISSGKYRTLILKSNWTEGLRKVIAAMSYQIIPADTQYAEVPLAAVSSNYQNKGIGHLMFTELKGRLQSVGISTILCWADKVSERFWFKQGFISIGEVDSKGKARRLPIKADIRRALCFPGGSTLMVAHLNKYNIASVNSADHAKLCFSAKSHGKLCSCLLGHMDTGGNDCSVSLNKDELYPAFHQSEYCQSQHVGKYGCSTDAQKENVCSLSTRFPCCESSVPCTNRTCDKTGVHPVVTENGCSTNSHRMKRCVWEASLSSLKSKRIRGGHSIDDCQENKGLDSDHFRQTDASFKDCSLGTSGCQPHVEIIPSDPTDISQLGIRAEGRLSGHLNMGFVLKGNCPRIMFMNIADDSKKTCLTQIVQELGGSVTCDGSSSTHVITGKARRTLNFCVALCSGAWIVSPQWLKASFREGTFLGESPFILEDEDYLLRYKFKLKDAVTRAKLNPHSLLRGYNVCLAKHIQPSVDVLSAIIKAAGGSVIRRLEGIKEPSRTIFLACEEDMEDAMVAAKNGVWAFSSDWFMSCVMKQELDMGAPQFAESL